MIRKLSIVFALVGMLAASPARALEIAATIPALGSIAKEVAGDTASVTILAAPNQDPHFIDARPSLVLRLNRTDLLIHGGLGLETGWLPTLLQGARNAKIQAGRPGNLDASIFAAPLLEVPATADRALGDVHPGGNPHYWLDPRRAQRIAAGIAERLAQLDAETAATYRANAAAFSERLQKRIATWEREMAPYRGRSVVTYHKSFTYLFDWLGLAELGTIEPLPGIPPSPSHLASLILQMRKEKQKIAVIAEAWHNQRTVRTVAERAEAGLLMLPGDVGARSGSEDYVSYLDALLSGLRKAFQG